MNKALISITTILVLPVILVFSGCSRSHHGCLSFEYLESGYSEDYEMKFDYHPPFAYDNGTVHLYERTKLVTQPPFRTRVIAGLEMPENLIELTDGDEIVIVIHRDQMVHTPEASWEDYFYITVPNIVIGEEIQIEPDSESYSVGYYTSHWNIHRYDQGTGFIKFISRTNDTIDIAVNISYFLAGENFGETAEGDLIFLKSYFRMEGTIMATIVQQ